MNINIIEYLNNLLEGTKITEFTIKKRDEKISITRDPEQGQALREAPAARVKQDKKSQPIGTETRESEDNLVKVFSKTVGVFYRGKTKIAPPLVKIDSSVKKGDQLGIINSMGVIEKVMAPATGTIKEVLVDNHKPVEYGQPLFVIEPIK
ncbi:MAG: hypothetical protein PHF84_10630 [bacterium]|nr:hypothetical protein [bacterium]